MKQQRDSSISAHDVSISYGSHEVLRRVSLLRSYLAGAALSVEFGALDAEDCVCEGNQSLRGGGGFDQGLEIMAPLAASGFRLIAVSRFGYLGTPLPAFLDSLEKPEDIWHLTNFILSLGGDRPTYATLVTVSAVTEAICSS